MNDDFTRLEAELRARASGCRVDLGEVRILVRDATGKVEISSSRGKHTLTVGDAEGKKVFKRPIDTAEQRKGTPADVLPEVQALEREQVITFPVKQGSGDDGDCK